MSRIDLDHPVPLRGGFARIVIPSRAVDQKRADHGDRFMPISHSAPVHDAKAVWPAIAGRSAIGGAATSRR
jgi:hypothetical protein